MSCLVCGVRASNPRDCYQRRCPYRGPMTTPTPDAREREENEARAVVQTLLDFAYEQGFHEMGYDPLAEYRTAILESERARVRAVVEVPPITAEDLLAFADEYDNDYRGGTGRGTIDDELSKRMAAWLNQYRETILARLDAEPTP